MDLHTSSIMAELPKLIASIKDELKISANIKEELKATQEIAASQQFLSNKFDEIMLEIRTLRVEMETLREENMNLKRSLKSVSDGTKIVANAVDRAELELDSHRRTQLSANAIILGMPRVPHENTDDLVLKTCQSLGYKNAKQDIVSCCRIASSKTAIQPIRVTFRNTRCKDTLMSLKKARGPLDSSMVSNIKWPTVTKNKVTIRDDLTPFSMRLLQELKTLQVTLNLRYVWPGRDGAIMVRREEKSKPIAIQTRTDIEKLVSLCRKQ